MRASRWIFIVAIGALLISGAAVVFVAEGLTSIKSAAAPQDTSATVREAQLRPTTPAPAPTPPRPGSAAPAAPAQPEAPRHIDTTQYDSWVVTCEDTDATNKRCVAALRVVNQNRKVMLNWQIGFNPEGHFVTAFHIPSALAIKQGDKTVGGAIRIPEGVELKFGNGPVRRLAFASCGPQQCVAEGPIDDAFVKEAVANAGGKANITIHTGGGAIPFDVPIKGIDKAISSVRK
jgi:invasion protein IalB